MPNHLQLPSLEIINEMGENNALAYKIDVGSMSAIVVTSTSTVNVQAPSSPTLKVAVKDYSLMHVVGVFPSFSTSWFFLLMSK